MSTRNKVATTSIEDGVVTFSFYDDSEPQQVHKTVEYQIRELSPGTVLNLAAIGFASAAGNRYQNLKDYQAIPDAVDRFYTELHQGDWKPGKRGLNGAKEPTDLMLALAEVYNKPIDLVQYEFETRMVKRNDGSLYTDAAGKPRRFFSVSTQRELADLPKVKVILARLTSERAKRLSGEAKSSKSPDRFPGLFDDTQA